MTNIESLNALGGVSTHGSRALSNITFNYENFDRLLIGPGRPSDFTVLVKDCTFSHCIVKGEFRIAQGVTLDNVLFDSVNSSDVMTISSQAVLDHVVVKGGGNCSGLWVKPSEFVTPSERHEYEKWAASCRSSISWMLDFSELESGEVEVVGLPLDKLRWNSERHVALKLDRFKTDIWKSLNFPPTSFWRLRLRRLALFEVTEGVFSLPVKSDRKYAQTKGEMLRLIQEGILD